MPTLNPGQTLDRYQIVAFLANGGMGEVYHARHLFMDRDVALKLVFPHLIEDAAMAERFQREVRSVTSLAHEHIVKVYDAGVADGHHFMAMEYLASGSLASEMRSIREAGEKMPVARAVEITRQIALALDYAHRAGFSHRDVKPGNVLKRSADVYVLTDFGLVLDETASRLTHTGWGMGTPTYMPPEQWNGQAVPQSDIYALGVTLFEMLAGSAPFRATSPSALMIKHLTELPPRLVVARPDAPAGLQNVLDIALAKKPEDRYQTGVGFAESLARVMLLNPQIQQLEQNHRSVAFGADQHTSDSSGEPSTAPLPTPPPIEPAVSSIDGNTHRSRRNVSRRRALSLVGGVGAIGLVSLVVQGAMKPSPAAPVAEPSTVLAPPTGTLTPEPTRTPSITATPTIRATAIARPTATPGRDRATLTLAPGVEMDFVRIPAGEFTMGTDEGGFTDERPQHRVTLAEYWIGRTPVTAVQFAAFVSATGFVTLAEKEGKSNAWTGSRWQDMEGANWAHPKGPITDIMGAEDHPVVHVSWDDVIAYCVWAGQVTGKTLRLPSEAEWEKAARGTDGRRHPWGDSIATASLANFNLNIGSTSPVGNYSPGGDSPYGCVDMAGNVQQWTNSLVKSYPYMASDGRESASDRGTRVSRGGGFPATSGNIRTAARQQGSPLTHHQARGFRVCMSSV